MWKNVHLASVRSKSFLLASAIQHISDEELLARYRHDGDVQWLGNLLERYSLLLFGVCMKYLKNEEASKDAVQQVFLKSLSELEKRYKIDNFGGWLYRICINHCLTRLRKRHEHFTETDIAQVGVLDTESETEEWHWERERESQQLRAAVQELKEDQRRCIVMFYFEKKSYHLISETTGYTVNEVKSHIQNGKRNLKIRLQKSRSSE